MNISMTQRIRSSHSSFSPVSQMEGVDISDIDIVLVCNDDIQLATLIVNQLRNKGAKNIRLCYPYDIQYSNVENINADKIPGNWDSNSSLEFGITNAAIVISLFYNDYKKQIMLFKACIAQQVPLFVTWDSGIELNSVVKKQTFPRTRLHNRLLKPLQCDVRWILFQPGIFDEEILKKDFTAHNSLNVVIFLNVTVKEDFARLVVESIISRKVQPNRHYIVGDFVSHLFLGHVYNVANKGVEFNCNMPATLAEFKTLKQLYAPDTSKKLTIESASFYYDTVIYKILKHHRQISLKEWFYNRIFNPKI